MVHMLVIEIDIAHCLVPKLSWIVFPSYNGLTAFLLINGPVRGRRAITCMMWLTETVKRAQLLKTTS